MAEQQDMSEQYPEEINPEVWAMAVWIADRISRFLHLFER